MEKIDPRAIQDNMIELIGRQWMLVTAGTADSFNTMTASWGSMGELWHKPVATIFIRPQRYTLDFVEREDVFTLSFFGQEHRRALQLCGKMSGRDGDKVRQAGLTPYSTDNGSIAFNEARMVLECRKLYVDTLRADSFVDPSIVPHIYPDNDLHKIFIGEITAAWVK